MKTYYSSSKHCHIIHFEYSNIYNKKVRMCFTILNFAIIILNIEFHKKQLFSQVTMTGILKRLMKKFLYIEKIFYVENILLTSVKSLPRLCTQLVTSNHSLPCDTVNENSLTCTREICSCSQTAVQWNQW